VHSFTPKLDILPTAQRRLWAELVAIPATFTLYGGTAIALHLGHRHSIDFDFFGDHAFAPLDLLETLDFLGPLTITQSEPSSLTIAVDRGGPVKLSFFGVPRIRPLRPAATASDNGVKIASLLDLAATKARVVQQRAEAKDYIDMDALITDGGISLSTALAAATAIYGSTFTPQSTLKALTYFKDPGLCELSPDLQLRLVTAVRGVDLSRLPAVDQGQQSS